MGRTRRTKPPKCKCCNDSKYVIQRKGGGFKCRRCSTIWNDYGELVGPQNLNPNTIFDPKRTLMLVKGRK